MKGGRNTRMNKRESKRGGLLFMGSLEEGLPNTKSGPAPLLARFLAA